MRTSPGARRRVLAATLASAAAGLVLCGCGGPSEDDVRRELADQRRAAASAAGDVAAVLPDGADPVEFAGRPTTCGGEPSPTIRFSAQGTWVGGPGTQGSRVESLAAGLRDAGWAVTSAGRSASGVPNARLSRDGLDLKIDPSPRRGSEDVVVQIAGACIDAPSDFANEQVPRTDEPLEPSSTSG